MGIDSHDPHRHPEADRDFDQSDSAQGLFAVEGLSESLAAAYDIASARLDSLRAGFDQWQDVTRSADYPEGS